ncbi:PEGA domain-containing protein [Candidatus Berkelbacteria bacterium]|nr:PEGA domain-containing protein [Candidatus Berkelbacteria bacterium]
MRSLRHRIITYVISVLAITAFSVTTVAALVWANGLKFDPQTKTFEQTVIIAVEAWDEQAKVYLNNQLVSTKLPYEQRSLPSGNYELKISKDGFYDFYAEFNLKGGEIGMVKGSDFYLIAREPIAQKQTFNEPVEVSYSPIESGLELVGNELYDRGKFVTRFSTEPNSIKRLNNNIIYSVNNEIRYYSLKHNTDELIYKVGANYTTNFSVNENDETVTIYSKDFLESTIIYFTRANEV